MKRIAIIEGSYVRDAQVFNSDPAIIENDPDWDENFSDLSCCHFIGVFEGGDENEILKKAAARQGVHPDIISLIDFGQQTNCVGCRQRPMKPNIKNLDEQDMILCPACGYGLAGADDDYFEFPKYCSGCGQMLTWKDNSKRGVDDMDNSTAENRVFFRGSNIPLTPKQLAKEAGSGLQESDYPERITGQLCDCAASGEFELLPKDDPAVVEGGKRYMECRICGGRSHL